MNDRMWSHPQTQQNVAHTREIGYHVLDPETGPLAVGEGSGPGRLPEPEVILAHLARLVEPDQSLRGKHVVVTAGATREAIDPVRFISNYSSGKMGFALATAAWERGADVTLIAGHVDVALPVGPRIVPVTTTADMQRAVAAALGAADVLIMAAAPADFTPTAPATQKIKKSGTPLSLQLSEAPDILKSTIAERCAGTIVVGFALETETVTEFARKKLSDKQLDMIVANQAGEAEAGFGADTNRVTLIDRYARHDSVIELPLMSKRDVADAVLDRVEMLLERVIDGR
jgi:phosphopantothenoylcysteine decarboxylase/phosphopantothenate--cysteine ligase